MKVLTVIPIKRGVGKETLSYFTSVNVSLGSIVKIPIRNSSGFGIVIDIKDAKDIKVDIKSLAYNLKKIENVETHTFLLEEFVQSAKKIAEYNAASLGGVLSLLIPKIIIEHSGDLNISIKDKPKTIYKDTGLLQSDEEERYSTYKSLIREEFAKGHSVFFCLPTTEDILNSKNILEKGIEKYTYVLHSGIPKKQVLDSWQKILNVEHPVLIIATSLYLSIPKRDIGVIILEKESSRSYKIQTRPYIDMRDAALMIAGGLGTRIIFGDSLLRIETLYDEKSGKYSELSPLKYRSMSTAKCEIIEMKTPEDMKKKEFEVISDKVRKLIITTKENNENTFLFCGRKGLFPTTVCSDCGRVVACNTCNSPVVLYSKKNFGKNIQNIFVCHHCGERRDAAENCKHCGGWRLSTFGVGIENVAEKIREIDSTIEVFIMDKDHVKTHKQASKIRDSFYNTPGSILLGTEMALTYLNQKIQNSAVISIDSYFSIPDFRINEKVFHILLSMRQISENHFFIQTRKENIKIFDHAIRGNLSEFYRDEIEDRKATDYPPFAKYIKISLEGEKNQVHKEMEKIKEFLIPTKLDIYEAFSPGSSKKFTVHGLISLKKEDWPNDELINKLKSLPLNTSIRVDPSTLL